MTFLIKIFINEIGKAFHIFHFCDEVSLICLMLWTICYLIFILNDERVEYQNMHLSELRCIKQTKIIKRLFGCGAHVCFDDSFEV